MRLRSEASSDLQDWTKKIAENLGFDGDYSYLSSPNFVYVRIGRAEAKMSNWDGMVRMFLWLAALMVVPYSLHFGSAKVGPPGVAMCGLAFVISGLGLICRAYLDSGFDSRVMGQLKLKARATALAPEELACEAIVALWAIQNRPFLSTSRVMWGNPFALDNNMKLGVGESLARALRLIAELPPSQRNSWVQRSYYYKLVDQAAIEAEAYRDAWFRTVKIPTFVCGVIFRLSGAVGLFLIAYPFLKGITEALVARYR
jgi:hypothetical protein